MIPKDTLERILELAPKPGHVPGARDAALLLPVGMKVEDVSRFFPPDRIQTVVALDDPASFSAYVNRFKDSDTLIFARVDDESAKFTAILDYHRSTPIKVEGTDNAGNSVSPADCAHVATLQVEETTEWCEWMKHNGQDNAMTQLTFAAFLEEHQHLIVAPTGAELLELVTNLEAKRDVRFNSWERLQDGGSKILFDEDIVVQGAATPTKGALEVPKQIEAGIEPFHGVGKYRINARLKYRIANRAIVFWYETITPHIIVRDAIAGVLQSIYAATGITPMRGDPHGDLKSQTYVREDASPRVNPVLRR